MSVSHDDYGHCQCPMCSGEVETHGIRADEVIPAPQMVQSYNNEQVIGQIDSGSQWSIGNQTANTITYGITTNRLWFNTNYAEYSGWSALNAKQETAAIAATELWDDIIAADIVAAGDPNSADIRFSNSSTGVSYAHAYYPGAVNSDIYSWEKAQGSIWFNPTYGSLTDPDVGEYGFQAVIHEIGHTLGLSHPGNYNGGSPTYANDAQYAEDTHQYTVMSYFNATDTGADWWAGNGSWQWAQTPMLHDILVAQSMYGAEYATRGGDTTYGFNSTADQSLYDFTQNLNPVLTIWDGAGNDTLDFSGWITNSNISLVEESFSHANAMTHNIAIAFGTAIENAVGGSGNDNITGNDLDNVLTGGAGADVLHGGIGTDTLSYATSSGGVVLDLLAGSGSGGDAAGDVFTGIENIIGSATIDTLIGDGGRNILAGGAGDDILFGRFGNDVILGEAGDDTLFGDDASGMPEGIPGIDYGADQLFGGAGNDNLFGEGGADFIDGGEGTDLLNYSNSPLGVTTDLVNGVGYGPVGSYGSGDAFANIENIQGSDFDDILIGTTGDNTLMGGAGNDLLIGSVGADVLEGGAGIDMFAISSIAEGGDIIADFDPNGETLDLRTLFAAHGLSTDNVIDQGILQITGLGGGSVHTIVSIDLDGYGGVAGSTLYTLVNVNPNQIALGEDILL